MWMDPGLRRDDDGLEVHRRDDDGLGVRGHAFWLNQLSSISCAASASTFALSL